ncbi:hypothetical protein [Ruegeria sp. HKCCD6157]|uniref:phage integrase central domain-containing protein n=1 Tax=unclassified Ruegeria TaxID=2625375 RepID=UPI0035304EC2
MALIAFDRFKKRLRGDGARGRWFSTLRIHIIPKIGNRLIRTPTGCDVHDGLKPIWRAQHETADKTLYRRRKVLRRAKPLDYNAVPFICDKARHMLGHVEQVSTPLTAIHGGRFRISTRSWINVTPYSWHFASRS